MADQMKGFLSILVSTCRIVACVIPSFIQLGLIDRTYCVLVGASIGIAVAVHSLSFEAD